MHIFPVSNLSETRTQRLAALRTVHADVIWFLGSVLDFKSPNLDEDLDILRSLPQPHKLLTVGLTELLSSSSLTDYAAEIQSRLSEHRTGIKCLDWTPAKFQGVTFIGSLGWYQGEARPEHRALFNTVFKTERLFRIAQLQLALHIREARELPYLLGTYFNPTNYSSPQTPQRGWDGTALFRVLPPLALFVGNTQEAATSLDINIHNKLQPGQLTWPTNSQKHGLLSSEQY